MQWSLESVSNDSLQQWIQAGCALAGLCITVIGLAWRYMKGRFDHLHGRLDAIEELASDAYTEAGLARKILDSRRRRGVAIWPSGLSEYDEHRPPY